MKLPPAKVSCIVRLCWLWPLAAALLIVHPLRASQIVTLTTKGAPLNVQTGQVVTVVCTSFGAVATAIKVTFPDGTSAGASTYLPDYGSTGAAPGPIQWLTVAARTAIMQQVQVLSQRLIAPPPRQTEFLKKR